MESPQSSNTKDWCIEVNVPKTRNISLAYTRDEESEGSSVTKTFERTKSDITSVQDTGYEYVPMDDKQESSSVTVIDDGDVKRELVKSNQNEMEGEISREEQRYFSKSQDRKSLDSTVTESSSVIGHESRACCVQTTKEMASIKEKLLEIESKQSNLLDLLQVLFFCSLI